MVQIEVRRFVLSLLCVGVTTIMFAQWSTTLSLSASVNYGFFDLDRRPGINFAVQNLETGEIYDSQSLDYTGLSRHTIIGGLPEGDYQLIHLGRIASIPTVDSNVVRAFNVITVKKGRHYYLGFINGRARAFKKGVLEVQMCAGDIEKLERKLIAKDALLEGEKLEAIYPYKQERFTLPL